MTRLLRSRSMEWWAFVIIGVLVSASFARYLSASRHLHQAKTRLEHQLEQRPTISQTSRKGFEGAMGDAARSAGVRKLLSVAATGTGGDEITEIQWESSQTACLQFLRELESRRIVGSCRTLRLVSSDGSAGLLRGDAAFAAVPLASTSSRKESTKVAAIRDVFKPLWIVRREDPEAARARDLKKQEEARLQEEQRLALERQKQQEVQELQAKKNRLENGLVVTGIVHNGREALAFVDTRDSQRQTLMLRQGDTIQEARVTLIDDKKGEVHLDYTGKFQVMLRLNSSSSQGTP